jgi:hypothetical protein
MLCLDFGLTGLNRHNADSTNAIRTELQQEAKVILFSRAARPGLASAKPTFRCQMLEKRSKAPAPKVIALLYRQGTSDRRMTIIMIQEAGIGV